MKRLTFLFPMVAGGRFSMAKPSPYTWCKVIEPKMQRSEKAKIAEMMPLGK